MPTFRMIIFILCFIGISILVSSCETVKSSPNHEKGYGGEGGGGLGGGGR